jgi:cell division protein FtsL
MEMVEVLGVSNSFLTYHLDNLGELIGKMGDGKYRLSSFGEAAMSTMTKVEDIPTTPPHHSTETRPKRVIRRSVAIALGLICIVLIALVAYFAVAGVSAQNSYNNLENQNKQLNATIAEQQEIADLQELTVIVQNYLVAYAPFLPIVVVSNNTVLPSKLTPYYSDSGFNQIPSYHVNMNYAGYIIVNTTLSNSIVELEYSSNGLNYNNTVNLGNDTATVFPVLPTGTLTILVGSNYSSFPYIFAETTTITYYY